MKEGFLKEYLEADQGEPKGEGALRDQVHETPIHGELNTISGGFSGGGNSTSKRKRYAQIVMSLEGRRPYYPMKDVVPYENDPVVLSIVTVGRKVHRVLIDQGSSVDMMLWGTFTSL